MGLTKRGTQAPGEHIHSIIWSQYQLQLAVQWIKMCRFVSLVTVLLLLSSTGCQAKLYPDLPGQDGHRGGQDKIRLQDIQSLTLRPGKMTTGRRSAPIQQMTCVGGGACSAFTPPAIQCINRGFDGYDVNWECKADLENDYRFGDTTVACEGYDYPDDPYVLRGSCGVEYTLEYTSEGKNRQRQHQGGHHNYNQQYNSYSQGGYQHNRRHSQGSSTISSIMSVLFLALFFYTIAKTCFGNNRGGTGGATGGGGGNNWMGGGGGGFGGGGGGSGSGPYCNPSSPTGTTGTAGGGYANFWTGLGLGGLLGTMYNRQGGYRRRAPGYGFGNTAFGGRRGGGFGGGGLGGGGGGFSSGSRMASGFGGTRRR